jgi:ElaB/YqjD/DUF883 family membrane-anchored ribosome-binding protein
MSDQFADASEGANPPLEAVNGVADRAQRALNEAMGAAERTITTATRAAERLLKESLDTLRAQTDPYADGAVRYIQDGQRYVADHVKQRPVTFTLAGLGVGLLLGVLLWSSANKPSAAAG